MSKSDIEYKKYDHASSLSRQIERVNEQITKGLAGTEHDNYNNYLDSIIMGLMTIENFYLHPFTGEDYTEFSQTNILASSNTKKLEFINKAQQKLSQLMDDQQLFFTSYQKQKLGKRDKNGEQQD